ncbi:MAG: hypothetical protein Kow0077_16910 [Anaerolineae bacterium]
MAEILKISEYPESQEMYMIAGWRQWADAGSVSSGLPRYLAQSMNARLIGIIPPDDFYLFQIPATHDLVRPFVRFEDGYPETLETPRNEFYFAGDKDRGLIIFIGDEPHMNVERYTKALLDAAERFHVRRIVTLGGVYGELPYNRARSISAIVSLKHLRDEIAGLAVELSEYQGGASIGSYLCHRAGQRGMACVGFYAFVPTYDFTEIEALGSGIRIENDFMAWLGIMRRVNHMLKLNFDLAELRRRSEELIDVMDAKVDELDKSVPEIRIRDYFAQLAENFKEVTFDPLADVWEEELRRLFDEDEGGQ